MLGFNLQLASGQYGFTGRQRNLHNLNLESEAWRAVQRVPDYEIVVRQ